jgi:hypothetical protein
MTNLLKFKSQQARKRNDKIMRLIDVRHIVEMNLACNGGRISEATVHMGAETCCSIAFELDGRAYWLQLYGGE